MALKFLGISVNSSVEIDATNDGQFASGTAVWGDTSGPSAPSGGDVSNLIDPTVLDGTTIAVAGGRTSVFEDETPLTVDSIEITTQPAHGNVTVRSDNTVALVLTGSTYSGALSFNYTITRTDTSTENLTANLTVASPTMDLGWGVGDHYMLEVDASGDLVVEAGSNHRVVYISNSPSALDANDIAALEGITAGEVTRAWLTDTGTTYGTTTGAPLVPELGTLLYGISVPDSNWLLFERGYTYGSEVNRFINFGATGESPKNPLRMADWGTGDKPKLSVPINQFQVTSSNIVIQNFDFLEGGQALGTTNLLFDNCRFYKEMVFGAEGGASGHTIRNCQFLDVQKASPEFADWSQTDRNSGIFSNGNSGILIEDSFFSHNGWGEGYDGTATEPQPPTQYSHNIYLGTTTSDVTIRNCLLAQAASIGAACAGGAFFENNAFLDNNIGVSINATGLDVGNFSFLLDNVVTSAGFKSGAVGGAFVGAKDWGFSNNGRDTVMINNIVAHNSDPDDTAEVAYKGNAQHAVRTEFTKTFDDTLIYNWRSEEENIGSLVPATLDQITIQDYAAALIGGAAPANTDEGLYYKSGWIYSLIEYAKANWADGTLTSTDIVEYFQSGFGIPEPAGTETSHTFVPSAVTESVRWDNRLNWSNSVVPGRTDTVFLSGNNVRTYATFTGTVNLNGGTLTICGGKFSGSIVGPGTVILENAGQRDATLSGGATETDNR